jgi:hypothetical protein
MRKKPRLQNIILLVASLVLIFLVWNYLSQVAEDGFALQLPSETLFAEDDGTHFLDHHQQTEYEFDEIPDDAKPYLTVEELFEYQSTVVRAALEDDIRNRNLGALPLPKAAFDSRKCQMESCFDFTKCQNDFKAYVYPPDKFVPISMTYEKILNRIMSSPYYTTDPQEACLFVLSIDTLDRDSLSHDFVRNLGARLQKLQVWSVYLAMTISRRF